MKKYLTILCSFVIATFMLFTVIPANAADGDLGVSFEGDSDEFITYHEGSAFEALTPGEERIQQITLTNNDYREMKFYVRGEYTNPLGEGKANEEIAYDITFSHNNDTFFHGQLGGVTKANMDSMNQNYLLKTLKKGESIKIDFKMKPDGDSMDNTYQGSVGYINLIFSVEHDDPNPIIKVVEQVKKLPIINKIPGIDTGDTTVIGVILGVFAASIIVIITLIIHKLKRKKEEMDETA